MEKLTFILLIAYMVAGYWAAGQTIYRNRIVFERKIGDYFVQRLGYGLILGWALIPIAIIRKLIGR